eukprot:scaffold177501_cov36-Prasinocladus_malaysianus.AAC.1
MARKARQMIGADTIKSLAPTVSVSQSWILTACHGKPSRRFKEKMVTAVENAARHLIAMSSLNVLEIIERLCPQKI